VPFDEKAYRNKWRRETEGIHGQAHPVDLTLGRNRDPRCMGTVHARGDTPARRCRLSAGKNMRTCKWHGGSTIAAHNAAARREQYETAKLFLARLGVPIKEDPRVVLLKQVYAANGMQIAAAMAVQQLTTNDLDDPTEETAFKLKLYAEWTDRAAKLSQMATSIGLEERMVHLAESQGRAVVSVVRAIINGIGLSPDQSALAYKIAAEQLRSLAPQFTIVEGSVVEHAKLLQSPLSDGPINVTPVPITRAEL
jgi:hypothetical protein